MPETIAAVQGVVLNKPKIIFGAPFIRDQEINEVVATLRSGWIGRGPKVVAFEQAFAKYKKVPFAIGVSSCSAALHLSLIAAGLGPGDEVITTSMTFCATVNAIIHVGATPVIVDIDPETMNIDIGRIQDAITEKTKGIIPVHLAGRPCELGPILDLARRHGLVVIEDCAHAIEAEYEGRGVGTFGDFGCFSFYPTKNITTGEGGMVVTQDARVASLIRTLSQQGNSSDAWNRVEDPGANRQNVINVGYKYNMTDINAAIGIHQLKDIEQFWQRRSEIWSRYDAAFADLAVVHPAPVRPGMRHALHLYTLLIDSAVSPGGRDAFIRRMHEEGIVCGIHYRCLAEQPIYQHHYGWRPEDFPVATRVGNETVSLPLSPAMSDEQVEFVVATVRDILPRNSVRRFSAHRHPA